ncbi:YbhB/YbcL family Raf kinase inhibitor-like protein [Agromyces sp. G08B096]|uniref:YbhB/YbcL family Raf kinase inhibitor-like protein n=1 Tax=Agromyces sp. G08B096 TaxID=3156399 RepID=A0AAU7W5V3_9MICO
MFSYDPYAELQSLRPVEPFAVTSTDFTDGQELPRVAWGASAGGEDRSPQLAWGGFPEATRSFAVTCFDPDAPTASGWWHWAVANIPADVSSLPADAGAAGGAGLPHGALALPNEARLAQYSGPTPPARTGVHRYVFVVHALDVERLDLDGDATPAQLGFHAFFHALGRAGITGTASGD